MILRNVTWNLEVPGCGWHIWERIQRMLATEAVKLHSWKKSWLPLSLIVEDT